MPAGQHAHSRPAGPDQDHQDARHLVPADAAWPRRRGDATDFRFWPVSDLQAHQPSRCCQENSGRRVRINLGGVRQSPLIETMCLYFFRGETPWPSTRPPGQGGPGGGGLDGPRLTARWH